MDHKKQAAINIGHNAAYLLDKLAPFFGEIERQIVDESRANFRLPKNDQQPLEFFMAKLCAVEDLKTTLAQKIAMGERYAKESI